MVKLVWSESAIEDLRSIHDYIALDSPKYAKQFATKLIERIDQLENFPRSGRELWLNSTIRISEN